MSKFRIGIVALIAVGGASTLMLQRQSQTLLGEAVDKFPADPQVAFERAFQKGASPEERAQALEAFKNADPNNSLPNYLSASDYFKAGKVDEALQELKAASAKPQFQDFTPD